MNICGYCKQNIVTKNIQFSEHICMDCGNRIINLPQDQLIKTLEEIAIDLLKPTVTEQLDGGHLIIVAGRSVAYATLTGGTL